MPANTFFVSDLHLFSRRSRAVRHLDAIQDSARDARHFVFGGDIFDFRWTTLPSIPATIDAAIDWLDEIVSAHRQCQFHFVLGNHDSHREFVRQLEQFARSQANLAWHPFHVRIGPSLFLHGDVTDGAADTTTLARRRDRWHEDRKKGPVSNKLYDLAIQARMHKLVSTAIHREPFVVRRVHRYVENVGHGTATGLTDVYFGHTHASMADVFFDGLMFHNGGAPMDGLDFRIVRVREQGRENVAEFAKIQSDAR